MPNQSITTYTNQRTVRIHKATCDRAHLYTANNLQALDYAMEKLSSIGGVKLWLYLAKNQNNHIRALSSRDFCEWANVSIKSYNTGFKELKDEGFLVEVEGNSNLYDFNEWGKCNISATDKEEKKETKNENGFNF